MVLTIDIVMTKVLIIAEVYILVEYYFQRNTEVAPQANVGFTMYGGHHFDSICNPNMKTDLAQSEFNA